MHPLTLLYSTYYVIGILPFNPHCCRGLPPPVVGVVFPSESCHCAHFFFFFFNAPSLRPFIALSCVPFLHCDVVATLQRIIVHALLSSCHCRNPSTCCCMRPSFIAPPCDPSTCRCTRPSFIMPLSRPFNPLLCMPFLHCAVVTTLQCVVVHALPSLCCCATLQRVVMHALPSLCCRCNSSRIIVRALSSSCRCCNRSMRHHACPSCIAPPSQPFTHHHAPPSFIAPSSRPFNALSCMPFLYHTVVTTLQCIVVHALLSLHCCMTLQRVVVHVLPSLRCRCNPSHITMRALPSSRRRCDPSMRCGALPSIIAPPLQPFNALSCTPFISPSLRPLQHVTIAPLHCAVVTSLSMHHCKRAFPSIMHCRMRPSAVTAVLLHILLVDCRLYPQLVCKCPSSVPQEFIG